MRVALFVDQFPELTETFISGEARALAKLGVEVHVEAGRPAPHPDPAVTEEAAYLSASPGALLWLVARHPVRCLRDLVARRRWRREEEVRPLRELASAARRAAGCDHLHAHFAAGAALDALRVGALLGVPYSVMTHGYDIYARPRNLCEKLGRAAFALSACEYSAEHLRERCGRDVRRLIAGVDPERFRRSAPHPGGRTVIAVARLVEKKGLRFLVEAAAQLGDVRVWIVGDGPLRDALRRQIDALGAPVELLGARTPAQTRDLLERADVLVAPSVVAADGDRDTMPVVVKEALAMEVPVVASDDFGLPEVVTPDWGRLAPPGDPGALASAIRDVLALPVSERAAMGARGRVFVVEHCSLRGETERLLGMISETGARAGRRSG